jgi:hypothetical protein
MDTLLQIINNKQKISKIKIITFNHKTLFLLKNPNITRKVSMDSNNK